MVRQKDQFWEYAEDLKGRFVCKFCHKNYPGGIARVKSHLSRLQGRDIAICNSVPEDVQALALTAVRGKEFPFKKRKTAAYLTDIEGNGVGGISVNCIASCPDFPIGLDQTTLPAICDKKDQELADRMVAQAFITNNIALDVIQSPSFTAMVKAIAEFGPGYSLPSCETLCTKLVTNARKEVEEYVAAVKASWSLTGCTLMSDIWTDVKDCSFVNVVAYSPKGAVFLKSFETTDKLEHGAYLGDMLLSITDDIRPENVTQIVVNGASNDDYSDDFIAERYPHIYITRCASRGIQLLLNDIYKEVEWIQGVFDDTKLIVAHIYKYPALSKVIRAHTGDKELRRPTETMIPSYFLMLQSILEVQDSLHLMVVSPEWNDVNDAKSPMEEKTRQIIRSVDFWNQGKEVILTLEPLIRVLHLVDGQGSTAGYLYEAMEMVRVELERHCKSNSLKYSKVLEIFISRRDKNIVHKIHAAAAFLNPSLMYDGKIKYEEADIRQGMNYVLESMVTPNEMDHFAAELLLYTGKSLKLFDTLSVLMMKKAHPRVWWEFNGGEIPLLQRVAIRILSQPCSSSVCRRNCGAFEVAQTKKINKTCEDVVEELIYTRMNSKMMACYKDVEMQEKFGMDLKKLGEVPEGKHDCDERVESEEGNTKILDRGSSSQLCDSVSDSRI